MTSLVERFPKTNPTTSERIINRLLEDAKATLELKRENRSARITQGDIQVGLKGVKRIESHPGRVIFDLDNGTSVMLTYEGHILCGKNKEATEVIELGGKTNGHVPHA